MNLASRCPSCGTVFRVVRDQLLVSEGWVRCGRCNGVFDATEELFDIESGTPMRLQPEVADDALPPSESLLRRPAQALDEPPEPQPALPPEPAVAPPSFAQAPVTQSTPDPVFAAVPGEPEPPAPSGTQPAVMMADAEPLSRLTESPQDIATGTATAAWAAERAADSQAFHVEIASQPSFVRQAQRQALWQGPLARTLMIGLALLLVLLAALQLALLKRDLLAARHPAWAPALQTLCAPFVHWGCQVQPLRRIDLLAVESSSLQRLDAESTAEQQRYRFGIALRSRADTPLMLPALELSLTDAQGRLVSRRMLRLAEMGARDGVIAAGGELALQAQLSSGDRRVEGYTVELFYP